MSQVRLSDEDRDRLRDWYGVLRGNGYARDDDVALAQRIFKGLDCACGRDVNDRCWACEDASEES